MYLFSLTALLAFLISFASAVLANSFLVERIPILGDFLGLTLSQNPGIAFGWRFPPVIQTLLIFAALVVVCVLAVRTVRERTHDPIRTQGRLRLAAIGYGLIIGGALGNIVDRLPRGLVTDFIQVGSFPVFNVADSCITVGVAFVLAASIKLNHNSKD